MLPNKTHSIIIMETQKAAKDLSNQLRILRNLKKSMVRRGGHSKGGAGVEKSHSSELRLTMNLTKLVSIEGFDTGSIEFFFMRRSITRWRARSARLGGSLLRLGLPQSA
jgi:hypothetical protein